MYIYSSSKNRRSGTAMQKLPLRGSLTAWEEKRVVLTGFPVTEVFKSDAEVTAYLDHEKITCLLCGKEYTNLGTHSKRIHQIDADDYRRRYHIPSKFGLIGKGFLEQKKRDSIFAKEPRKYAGNGGGIISTRQRVVPDYKRAENLERLREMRPLMQKRCAEAVTKVGPDMVRRLCDLIKSGKSINGACKEVGTITYSGFKKTMRRAPDVRQAVNEALSERTRKDWPSGWWAHKRNQAGAHV